MNKIGCMMFLARTHTLNMLAQPRFQDLVEKEFWILLLESSLQRSNIQNSNWKQLDTSFVNKQVCLKGYFLDAIISTMMK